MIAGSVDDRTEEERGLKVSVFDRSGLTFKAECLISQPLKNDKYRIPKSRYDSVDCYIANDSRNKAAYNDIDCPINEGVFERLKGHGMSTFVKPGFSY